MTCLFDRIYFGTSSSDSIDGDCGDDWLSGGAGNDRLSGGPGDDLLRGGDGNDRLNGGSGADELEGGAGADELTGGGLVGDTFIFAAGDSTDGDGDVITDFATYDRIVLNDFRSDNLTISGLIEDDRIITLPDGGKITLLDVDDVPLSAIREAITIKANGGDDELFGGPGDDVLDGGLGNDDLRGYGGDDRLDGGPGNDRLAGMAGDDDLDGGYGDDTMYGGTGDDELNGSSGDDRLFGGPGDDQLDGWSGDNHLQGGPGNDRLDGGDNDTMYGGTGDDELNGSSGDDRLFGGPGDDRLDGGGGDDHLQGGPGADIFIFAKWGAGRFRHDGVITDFDYAAGDRIELGRGFSSDDATLSDVIDADDDGDLDDRILTLLEGERFGGEIALLNVGDAELSIENIII